MGLYLIAVTWNLNLLWIILQVAFGLGMVIFVHELGHFAVAKLCGVKCEKFYLGFDIYGLKLFKFRWGETEYGIGILPLGGYVKMLGQDDNPARAAEERERSKLKGTDADQAVVSTDRHDLEGEALDPRSYMAQSVPRRMAIISAGVIMNVLFAVLMAAVAYGIGVQDVACSVSAVIPGKAAWRANLQPCDRILEIEGRPSGQQLRFRDLMSTVALADPTQGVRLKVQRHGVPEPFWLTIKPDPAQRKRSLAPTIGAVSPFTLSIGEDIQKVPVSEPIKAAKFKAGDTIVAVDGAPVREFCDLLGQLTRKPDRPLELSVRRKSESGGPSRVEKTIVPASPMKTLGIVMRMGAITAVQSESPAAKAGIQAGDRILTIDGQSPGDPMTLPERLRRRAGETITLTLKRKGEQATVSKEVRLRDVPWYEKPMMVPGSPESVPELGIAYSVLNVVSSVESEGPAAAAKFAQKDSTASTPGRLKPGDEIVKASFDLPKKKKDEPQLQEVKDLTFSAAEPNWSLFSSLLQALPDGTKVVLTLADGRTARLLPAKSREWFDPDRGFLFPDSVFEPVTAEVKAHSVGQALGLGLQETKESLLQVYQFLQRIFQQRISPFGLGGPITIFQVAGKAASRGVPDLLIFLTMLSANLAVINFLPIPLLDGGHMVFLILEGIRRKPVSERVIVAFHYAGFVFIIGLMLFVLSLDLGLISRFGD